MHGLRYLISALAWFAWVPLAASQIAHALPAALQPCSVPGVNRSARCGTIEVPENPDQPGSRKLEIHFAVIPAANGHALPDPVVPLLGGPGESAIEAAQWAVDRLAPMLNDRDLLLADERGTGQSNALRCQLSSSDDPAESLQNLFPLARVRAVRRTWPRMPT